VILQCKLLICLANFIFISILSNTKSFVKLGCICLLSTATTSTASAATTPATAAVHTSKVLKRITTSEEHFYNKSTLKSKNILLCIWKTQEKDLVFLTTKQRSGFTKSFWKFCPVLK
jgi:hypothetical protein